MTCWAKLISFSKYFSSTDSCDNSIVDTRISLVDTGRKLKVHKTFRRRPGRLLNVLCTFNLRPVSTGTAHIENTKKNKLGNLSIHFFQFESC